MCRPARDPERYDTGTTTVSEPYRDRYTSVLYTHRRPGTTPPYDKVPGLGKTFFGRVATFFPPGSPVSGVSTRNFLPLIPVSRPSGVLPGSGSEGDRYPFGGGPVRVPDLTFNRVQ